MRSILPVYKKLLAAMLQILVYSGDIDSVVPFTGTQAWLDNMGLPVIKPFAPWQTASGAHLKKRPDLTTGSCLWMWPTIWLHSTQVHAADPCTYIRADAQGCS